MATKQAIALSDDQALSINFQIERKFFPVGESSDWSAIHFVIIDLPANCKTERLFAFGMARGNIALRIHSPPQNHDSNYLQLHSAQANARSHPTPAPPSDRPADNS
jgi:hypothetical protein